MSKITVLLPEPEFARFDAYCDELGFKKSTLIARLIREHLDSVRYPGQTRLDLGPLADSSRPASTKELVRSG